MPSAAVHLDVRGSRLETNEALHIKGALAVMADKCRVPSFMVRLGQPSWAAWVSVLEPSFVCRTFLEPDRLRRLQVVVRLGPLHAPPLHPPPDDEHQPDGQRSLQRWGCGAIEPGAAAGSGLPLRRQQGGAVGRGAAGEWGAGGRGTGQGAFIPVKQGLAEART